MVALPWAHEDFFRGSHAMLSVLIRSSAFRGAGQRRSTPWCSKHQCPFVQPLGKVVEMDPEALSSSLQYCEQTINERPSVKPEGAHVEGHGVAELAAGRLTRSLA